MYVNVQYNVLYDVMYEYIPGIPYIIYVEEYITVQNISQLIQLINGKSPITRIGRVNFCKKAPYCKAELLLLMQECERR